jgi:branched-chain amino acid transport system substrate-binding protein
MPAISRSTTARGGEIVVTSGEGARGGRAVAAVPAELRGYAQGFLQTRRDSVRFLWRDGSTWLAVRVERQVRPDPRRDDALLSWAPTDLPGGVTAREIDILTLLALGLTNGQIAERLGTSARTVSTQVERLLLKLEQTGRGGLAALAVDAGLLRLPIPGGATGLTSIGPVEVEQRSSQLPDAEPVVRRHMAVRFPARRPFQVGTIAVSCGSSSADGLELARGSMLAVEEINSRGGIGGRPIEQVVVDVDMLDPDAVREGMVTLFDQEVDAITTSYLSAENPFVLELAADHGKPFLHTATFEEQVDLVREDPARYGNIFQTCPSETYYGNGFVRLLDDLTSRSSWRPHNRRIVSVEVDAVSTRTTNDTFLDSALQSGWELSELIRVPLGTRDWGDVVARIAALDPAAVMVTHFVSDEIVELQRSLHALGSPALVYYVYGASVPQFQDSLREAAEGVVWSTVTGLYDDALGRDFRQRYRRRFVLEPGWSIASAAYDQVRLLGNAWAATGGRDSKEVADYLRHTAHRGLNGVYFLGSPGQACLAYPDVTLDPSISQAHMVYQYQDGVARVIAPSFNGAVEAFRPPRAS